MSGIGESPVSCPSTCPGSRRALRPLAAHHRGLGRASPHGVERARRRARDPRRRARRRGRVHGLDGLHHHHRLDRRDARARRRRKAGAALLRRHAARRHRRLLHLRDRAHALRPALRPPAAGARRAGGALRGPRQRLRLLPYRRQDGRPLLHRLPLVLEHRRLLPLHAGVAARAERGRRARLLAGGVRADPLPLPLAHARPAPAHRRPRPRLGRRGALVDRPPDDRTARAGSCLARVPGLLRGALARPPRAAHVSADLARLAAGVLLVPEGAPEPVAFAAEELGTYLGRMFGREPARRSAAGPGGSWLCLAPEGTPVPERALAVPGGAEFVVQPAEDGAVVSGAAPRALVAGVYALLEAAGCRWSPHGSSGEHVPGPDGALRPVPTLEMRPAFARRAFAADLATWHYSVPERLAARLPSDVAFIDWMAKRGATGLLFIRHANDTQWVIPELVGEFGRRGLDIEGGGHALVELLPRSLFAAHPEYFPTAPYRGAVEAHLVLFAGRVDVFEYYGDAILFGGCAVPLVEVVQRDLDYYSRAGVRGVSCLVFGQYSLWAYGMNVEAFARGALSPAAAASARGTHAAGFGRAAEPVARYLAALERVMAEVVTYGDVLLPPAEAERAAAVRAALAAARRQAPELRRLLAAAPVRLAAEEHLLDYTFAVLGALERWLAAGDAGAREAALAALADAVHHVRAADPALAGTWGLH